MQFRRIQNEEISQESERDPISLIICLKNESLNLQKNYASWIGQLHENDELILVDDYSLDDTFDLASQMSSQNEKVVVIAATKNRPGKKQALIDGVRQAKNKIILVTDADCKPPINWKSKMLARMTPSADFVLGYGPFAKKDSFLNLFQRFECVLTAAQYFSYAKAGIPYMGVGRNLLFAKRIFDPKIYQDNLASGDDDLLVSAKANKKNVQICVDSETFVYSEAATSWRAYWRQKMRHVSSSVKYKFHIKFLLTLFSLTLVLSYLTGIVLLFSPYWQAMASLYLCKTLTLAMGLYFSVKILKEGSLFWYSVLLDPCLAIYYLILAFSFPFIKKTKWT